MQRQIQTREVLAWVLGDCAAAVLILTVSVATDSALVFALGAIAFLAVNAALGWHVLGDSKW